MKSTKYLGEFQKILDDDNKTGLCLEDTLRFFDMLRSQVQEVNISRYLLEIFWEIVNVIGEMLKIDCIELFEEIIRDNQRAEEIIRLFSPVLEKKPAA